MMHDAADIDGDVDVDDHEDDDVVADDDDDGDNVDVV